MEVTKTVYLRANRTIERIKTKSKTVYAYNYEGIAFYVFATVLDLFKHLKNQPVWALGVFETESEFDEFLTLMD